MLRLVTAASQRASLQHVPLGARCADSTPPSMLRPRPHGRNNFCSSYVAGSPNMYVCFICSSVYIYIYIYIYIYATPQTIQVGTWDKGSLQDLSRLEHKARRIYNWQAHLLSWPHYFYRFRLCDTSHGRNNFCSSHVAGSPKHSWEIADIHSS